MAAVDVGVSQDDHLVVPDLGDVEVLAHTGPDGGHQSLDLVVLEHLVDPGALDIEDLASYRQDGLVLRVPARTADPPAESPSTMNSSAAPGSRVRQSVSLPGIPAPSSGDLRRVASRRRAPPPWRGMPGWPWPR